MRWSVCAANWASAPCSNELIGSLVVGIAGVRVA